MEPWGCKGLPEIILCHGPASGEGCTKDLKIVADFCLVSNHNSHSHNDSEQLLSVH
jgi:hypothetical protein